MNTNTILKWLVLPASTLAIIGCGGGGSSTPSSVATGQAFYVDSAVQGVDYNCGTQSGVTGTRGEFTFDVGQGCTFSLDKIKLRDIAADQLENGKEIQETNVKIAQVLLSFDSDRNPSNGIQINSSFVKSFMELGITKFEEILSSFIPGFTMVSVAEAKLHLIESILQERTLYTNILGQNHSLESWTFAANFSSVTSVELEGGNERETVGLSFDSRTLTFTSSDGNAVEIKNITKEYLLIAINGDETRLYYDEAKARAYFLK